MNAQDYKLIPLDEIAASPALKASYIEMMRRLHHEFWHGRKDERFIYHDVMWCFADFDDLEFGFSGYLDYVHCRGRYADRSSSGMAVQMFGLVCQTTGTVLGEAGFSLKNGQDGSLICTGYDVIDPLARGRGLGNLIIGLRLHKAQELGADTMVFEVKPDNWRSSRRVEKLAQAGFVEKSHMNDMGRAEHRIPLQPPRTEQAYINAMLASRPGHELPEPEPFSP